MSKYIFNNDTDILEFLEQLRENGIQIWGEGEKIRYRSKNRQLAPETLRILKMAKGQILDFFRMIEKNVIPLTSIQTAYVVGQTAGCELGNINAHYYIEYTIESLDVERLEQMINLVISKNDALRLIVTHEGKASFLDNVPYYSVPVYSLYDGNDREQKRLERSHHRYNYYKWPMFHFCVGKTSGKTSVLHVDFDCIILDAWSAKLLLNEIFSLYYGKDVKFPRISFMNYMRLKTDKGDLEAEEYWKEKVKNMPSFPKLNYQKKFAEVQNVRFDRIECDFSFIETQRLYQKIKNYHFTPAAVISTIFMKTLAQYSETPGLSINVTLFNRQLLHEDVNGILGEFTNNAVISYQEKTDSLLDAIRATQEQMWRLVQYRKFEGSNILKMLSSGRAGKAIMPVACVVVPNAAGGGNGANIAKSILAKGIPTLLEHPAHEVEIVNCIRESGSAAFMLNPFYRYIKPIRDFLEAAQIISKHAHLINASLECAIHVLYDGIDILGCALGGLSTWKLGNVAESYTTSMAGGGNRVISGIIGMVPVTFIVNTNVDRNDIDHPLHLYHRIELTFSTGRLCLVNTHGPVIWLPFLHMPRDEYGTLSINVEEEVNIPSGVTIGNVMLPSVKETFEQIWPDAVKKALEILFKQNRTEKMSMAQYQIYVSKLWSEICQKVGYMNIVDYDNFGDIKSIFYDLEKRHLIKKENDGIE